MLRFDYETHRPLYDIYDEPSANALLLCVDGTHSSGKSTVIHDLLADKQLETHDFIGDFGTSHNHTYPFVATFLKVGELTVPMVVVSEVARSHDEYYVDRRCLTDGYNRIDQASITMKAMSRATIAASMAAYWACELQPERDVPLGIALTDRSALSGYAYAYARLPEEEHAVVDLAEISDLPTPSYSFHLAEQVSWLTSMHDHVFLAEHSETGLEDDGKRVTNDAFQDLIATNVRNLYSSVLDESQISKLTGDRVVRKSSLETRIQDVLVEQIAQQ